MLNQKFTRKCLREFNRKFTYKGAKNPPPTFCSEFNRKITTWFVTLSIVAFLNTSFVLAHEPEDPPQTQTQTQTQIKMRAETQAQNPTPTLEAGEADSAMPELRRTRKSRTDFGNQEQNKFDIRMQRISHKINDIQLVSPPHNSTLTTGVVTFQWKVGAQAFKKENGKATKKTSAKNEVLNIKIKLLVEKINSDRKRLIKTQRLQTHMFCEPGQYRWRVVGDAGKVESRWRLFKVIDFKFHRQASSVPQTLPLKNSPILNVELNTTFTPKSEQTPLHKKIKPLQPMNDSD